MRVTIIKSYTLCSTVAKEELKYDSYTLCSMVAKEALKYGSYTLCSMVAKEALKSLSCWPPEISVLYVIIE